MTVTFISMRRPYTVKCLRTGLLDCPGQGREAPTISLPHQDAECVSHIAVDIGGSLIKLVYFVPDDAAGSNKKAARHTGGQFFTKTQLCSLFFYALAFPAWTHQIAKLSLSRINYESWHEF